MMRWLVNVGLLCSKELRSLMHDRVLLGLIVFAFSAGVLLVANGVKVEVSNATIAFIDEDHSALSRRMRDAVLPPYFKPPVLVDRAQALHGMDEGDYIFVVDIPPNFESDVMAGRVPAIQLRVDATAMTQAGLGTAYLNEIMLAEVTDMLHAPALVDQIPFTAPSRIRFNPNSESKWFTSVMQIVTNITILSIVLVGAAVIREREHGTLEHLLVMPVTASEIAVAKIVTNGLVIFVGAIISLWLVVHVWLGVPLAGSITLFAACSLLYLFSATALGIMLATVAPTMPQFGLLVVPVYAVAYLLSGAATPVESMPPAMQVVVRFLPTTQFVNLSQAILYRDAGLGAIIQPLLTVTVTGIVFLVFALARFRSMLARQE
ncbi:MULTISPECIES: ABC transporter permease [Komagataeibacter]|uniref:ABC transporter multidrug permease n=2 Tax=Komagataeibacter TaxID=1434011 RepID=A0A0D6Q9F6_KOMXY|nr:MULTISPECIES: ABC transporter permease [Komagataeibacter]MBL7234369.1 ABC transporter permease [Komagataeibacter oboediens]MBT0675128.1 ABC transporter permease [Komagataeibacter oboediens]MBT0678739.1 ABC transporter permease [Komagataeibacter oboediens]MBV1823096.1 ABC transporter permease [Komagataeibacter oboediens]GAO00163.1 ABC transporter multidrug permease [Komagataeibacter xylinus NBRC 13693]